jgi:hypothetical protein
LCAWARLGVCGHAMWVDAGARTRVGVAVEIGGDEPKGAPELHREHAVGEPLAGRGLRRQYVFRGVDMRWCIDDTTRIPSKVENDVALCVGERHVDIDVPPAACEHGRVHAPLAEAGEIDARPADREV